ncbi:MAG: hypothetical protein QHH14_11400 [Clostridiales bacterium]|jgi:hypothetical protein|nr:hypothetical protein [Clostridiales bacterium]
MEAVMNVRHEIVLPIHYHSGQKKIFFESKAKKKVIAKGRRFGLTKGFANLVIEYLLEGIGPGLWVDTVNSNIDRYIERYFYPVLRHLPPSAWKWRQQKKELTIGKQKLDLRSADRPELIEGFGYRFIILNEAGIILRDEYLWHNTIQPMMLDYNPDVLIGGTPKGKGLFYRLAVMAQEKEGWEYFHFTSFDNPYLSKKELDELVSEIPPSIQKQEIYAEFLEDSSTVFRNIRKAIGAEPGEPEPGKQYVAGLDLARLQDYTWLIILDHFGHQVYSDRFNEVDWAIQKRRIAEAVKKYEARLIMDSTGIGDPIYEDLKNMGLNVEGYKLTNESKRQLIQALMMSFELEQIKIFDDPVLLNELEIFEYEISPSGSIIYSAPEGYHDDGVIALALANWGFKNPYAEPRVWRA